MLQSLVIILLGNLRTLSFLPAYLYILEYYSGCRVYPIRVERFLALLSTKLLAYVLQLIFLYPEDYLI